MISKDGDQRKIHTHYVLASPLHLTSQRFWKEISNNFSTPFLSLEHRLIKPRFLIML